MSSRSACPGCNSDDALFRRAMRSKRACPHCRLPAAAIAAVWYVRSHNVRPRRRSKDELDQLLDRVTQLENENSRLAKAVQAAPAPAVVEQLRTDLAAAQAQLAQFQAENARLAHELQARPTAVAGGPRADIEHQQDQDGWLDGQLQARMDRLGEQLVRLRPMVERLQAENARLTNELATRPPTPPAEPTILERLSTFRQDMTDAMNTFIVTAQKTRELLDHAGSDLAPTTARTNRRTGDRTDRVFMPGDTVQIGADDAPWVVTRTYTSTDPWAKLQHSVRTHELRSVRVRVLVKHQRAIALGNGARPRDILGVRLRELRVERSLTQTELATLCGLKPATLLNIEGGRRSVTLDTIYDLAVALDVPVADLFCPPATGDPAQ